MNVRLKLVFSEEKKPYLLDITSLLYDFELLHDFSLILWADDYSDYKFSRFLLYRNRRPIMANHKIRVVKIIKESPLIVVVEINEILALTGALWTMLLLIEKIRNWRLNREKLMYEVKKLKLETEKLSMELEQKLLERNAANILNSLLHRLESNPIKLEDVEAYVEEGNKNEKVTFT